MLDVQIKHPQRLSGSVLNLLGLLQVLVIKATAKGAVDNRKGLSNRAERNFSVNIL